MKDLKKLFAEVDSVEITDFETQYLIPMIFERIEYFLESFKKVIPICESQENAAIVDAAVRQVVPLPQEIASSPFPLVGMNYLQQVKAQVETDWVPNISKIFEKFPSSEAVKTGKDFYRLLQTTQNICSSISRCKNMIFKYQQKAFPIVVNRTTGQPLSGPPEIVEITTYPFEVILNDVENAANALLETLRHWNRSRQERRKDYIAYLAAIEQVRSAKWLNLFQLVMIIMTIILTILSSRIVELARQVWHVLWCSQTGG